MAFTVVGKAPIPNLIELWIEYCNDRGLTPEMLAKMKGELLPLETISKGQFGFGTSIWAMKQYGALGGFVFPLEENEYQVRLIYDPDFIADVNKPGDTIKARKGHKYSRPPGSANLLYLPPHITDWYSPEANYDLLIVEGALNAVRLCAAGYHAVAIQGVSSFRIGNKTSPIIPALKRLVESKQVQRVTYVPDSDTGDVDTKPALVHAVNTLCLELMKLRPDRQDTVYVCRPPAESDGSKNGPDDYLHKKGAPEFDKMLRENSSRFQDVKYLQIQKEAVLRYIYNETTNEYWDEKLRLFISPGHLNDHLKGHGLVEDIFFPRAKPIYYNHDRFRSAPNLRIASGIKYRPDIEDAYFSETNDLGIKWYVNRHNVEDVPKAIKGDVTIFYDMLKSLCRNSPSAIPAIMTILSWHARNPGHTPKYAILFTGKQRAGKSNMARCMGLALSKRFHSARVDPSSGFNDTWRGYACKEWAEFDPRMDPEWLKDLITSETYEVNGKNKQIYTENNCTLNIFTCNNLKSKIQEGDGRFVVAGYAEPDNKELGLRFEEWVSGNGPNYLRFHLLHDELDVDNYDRLNVWTEMKDEVIKASQSFRSSIKDDLLEEVEDLLPELECVPVKFFDIVLEPHRVHPKAFMNEFGQYFPRPALEKVKIDGTPVRFRALKNLERWGREVDTDRYREQYAMYQQFLVLRSKRKF